MVSGAVDRRARSRAGILRGRSRGLPPGPRVPIAAQTVMAWGPWGDRNLARLQRLYGDVFTIRIIPSGTMVMVADPGLVREIFTGSPSVFHAGEGNGVLEPVVGSRSVLLCDEVEHVHRRKLMLPLFHGQAVQQYGQIVEAVADAEIDSWRLGEPFRLHPRMRALTFEVIARAVFGVEDEERLATFRRVVPALVDIGPMEMMLWQWPGLGRIRPWRRYAQAQEEADALLRGEIRSRRSDPHLEERRDILSLLLQAQDETGRPMDEDDVRDQIATLLLAGHETTATGLAWAFELLLRNRGVLRRAVQAAKDGDDAYLDAVARETLRLRPVIPVVVRSLARPARVGDYELPAGVKVAPAIALIQQSAEHYPAPEEFRPERFLGGRAESYAWIPFGGGIRRCLGASFAQLEMRLVLSRVLRRARLEPVGRRPERAQTRNITSVPGRGVRVRLLERTSNG